MINNIIESEGKCKKCGKPTLLANGLCVDCWDGENNQPRHHAKCTNKELEVLNLISAGFNNPIIANKLNITLKTLKNHIGVLYAKTKPPNWAVLFKA